MVVEYVRSVCSVVWFKNFSIYPEPEDLSPPIAYYYLPPYVWPPRIPSYALIPIYYRISIPRSPPYASSLSTESPVYKSVRTGDRREIGDNKIKGNRLSPGVFWGRLKRVWAGCIFRGGVSRRLGPWAFPTNTMSLGRAAARHNAPKLRCACRVGPRTLGKKFRLVYQCYWDSVTGTIAANKSTSGRSK